MPDLILGSSRHFPHHNLAHSPLGSWRRSKFVRVCWRADRGEDRAIPEFGRHRQPPIERGSCSSSPFFPLGSGRTAAPRLRNHQVRENLAALSALPRLLLAAALVLLIGLLAALLLLVGLLAAALLLARTGIIRLLTRILILIGIVRIAHSYLLEGSGISPGP
jgi:hypothetical protein